MGENQKSSTYKARIKEVNDDHCYQTVTERQNSHNQSLAAKELRKITCKRVVDKLTQLIKLSLKSLAKNFESQNSEEDEKKLRLFKPNRFEFEVRNMDQEIIFSLKTY